MWSGTETAGLVVCGRPPSGNVTTVEEFDGTNWASGGAHPTAHAGNIVQALKQMLINLLI